MKRIILLALLLNSVVNYAQVDIKVLSYNVLNYYGNTASRADTLAKILTHYTPDLFMVQELKSEAGFQEIVSTLDGITSDSYMGGTYVSQVSNPSSSWKLQQNIVYNTRIFGLDKEEVIVSTYRDINYFKLFIKDADLALTNDTIFLHVFVTHLKSSQGSNNEQLRLEQSQTMRSAINALPANSNILCGGDFNVYTSAEASYVHLLETGLTNVLEDPIALPGNWHDSSYPNKEILTQSTRLTPLSDGAGGGMDDRFDFVLHSQTLGQGNPNLQYVGGTYKALGNNGTCYNQDLINCTSVNNLPYTMLSALYHFSDHLPVVFELSSDATLSTKTIEQIELSLFPNPATDQLTIHADTKDQLTFELHDLAGQKLYTTDFQSSASIDLSRFSVGTYLGVFIKQNRVISTKKVNIQ